MGPGEEEGGPGGPCLWRFVHPLGVFTLHKVKWVRIERDKCLKTVREMEKYGREPKTP